MVLLYIDPGSGSLMIQIVIAFFAGFMVFLSAMRHKIYTMFLRAKQFFKGKPEDE